MELIPAKMILSKTKNAKIKLLYKMEDIVKSYKKEKLDNQMSLFDLEI